MKIAIVTNDGKRVSAHFGQATHVLVVTAEDGKEVAREMRDRPHHSAHDHGHDHSHGQGSFFQQVKAVVSDCNVLIARGMGQPAFDKLQQSGIRPILTNEGDVETAVSAFLNGNLEQNLARVHANH